MDAPAHGGSAHRTAGEPYRRGPALLWILALLALVSAGACRTPAPAIDRSGGSSLTDGTITGTVRGPEGAGAIQGRRVEVINVETGERQSAITNHTGGFTFKVRPGRYKVELALGDGEALVRQPGTMNINRSEADAHADFVVGVRAFRPRPALRNDSGLGSPVA